ncbi:MAG: mannose-1-phosphate guanylyltransferase [Bacteroidota bacterium]|nr:MAG: mannose-1-phosphate guanylyltransferase [Bacteroidetes bacterium OLB12]GIL22491.1 MAG: mannose-1-phosphate guanylyltransferase [Bacteroidota bacterium]
MNKNLYVVLMAGGVGTRFWPYSRNSRPKQFLDVLGIGKTLLQSSYERFLPLCPPENIFVVTNEEHEAITRQQLPGLAPHQVLTEPMRKNTAPCIAFASYKINKLNPDAVMVVSPSDHLILNEADFQQTILKCLENAHDQNKLITLGIKPTRPETGYGYIQYLEGKQALKKVKTFTEKPELALAKTFLQSGDFLWNAGIFIWGVKAILQAFQKYLPEMAEVFEEASLQFNTPTEKAALAAAYSQTKNISIDYGIMEKADNVYVWLSSFAWSDLGSWNSLYDNSAKDENNNAISGDALIYETRNSVIKGPKDKLIVAQGLNGYLIGAFDNVFIVCEKEKEELFRRFVNDIKAKNNGNDYL